jgi:hypothetical protein
MLQNQLFDSKFHDVELGIVGSIDGCSSYNSPIHFLVVKIYCYQIVNHSWPATTVQDAFSVSMTQYFEQKWMTLRLGMSIQSN